MVLTVRHQHLVDLAPKVPDGGYDGREHFEESLTLVRDLQRAASLRQEIDEAAGRAMTCAAEAERLFALADNHPSDSPDHRQYAGKAKVAEARAEGARHRAALWQMELNAIHKWVTQAHG